MGNLLTYSAITAKLHAKQSRILKDEDFRRLAFLSDVPTAVETIKGYPAYGEVFGEAGNSNLHREQIETLLWLSLYQDFSSLYRFATAKQRKFLSLYFMHFEIDILKRCLRDAASSRPSDLSLDAFEDFFRSHSKLNLLPLAECTSIAGFVEGLKGSYYYEPLHKLYEEGVTTLFDYESALDSLYFTRLWKNLEKYLSSRDREAVIECIGERIDLLNLEWLSRAKQYYRLPESAIQSFLIPVCYRLRKKQVQDMAAARSPEEFLQILKGTRYGNRIFDAANAAGSGGKPKLKPLFRSLLDAVYESSRRKNPYSAAALNSYFYFKEEEIRKLITTVEGIRYKLGGNEILSCLAES